MLNLNLTKKLRTIQQINKNALIDAFDHNQSIKATVEKLF